MSQQSRNTSEDPNDLIIGQLGPIRPLPQLLVPYESDGEEDGEIVEHPSRDEVIGEDDTGFSTIEEEIAKDNLDATRRVLAEDADLREARRSAFAVEVDRAINPHNDASDPSELDRALIIAQDEVDVLAGRATSSFASTASATVAQDLHAGTEDTCDTARYSPKVLIGLSYKDSMLAMGAITFIMSSGVDFADPHLPQGALIAANNLISRLTFNKPIAKAFWEGLIDSAKTIVDVGDFSQDFSAHPFTTTIPIFDRSLENRSPRTMATFRLLLWTTSGVPRSFWPNFSTSTAQSADRLVEPMSEPDDTTTPSGLRYKKIVIEVDKIYQLSRDAAFEATRVLRHEAIVAEAALRDENVVTETVDFVDDGPVTITYRVPKPKSPSPFMPASAPTKPRLATPGRHLAATLNDRVSQAATMPTPIAPAGSARDRVSISMGLSPFRSTSNAKADALSRDASRKEVAARLSSYEISDGFHQIPVAEAIAKVGVINESYEGHEAAIQAMFDNRNAEATHLTGIALQTHLRTQAYRNMDKKQLNSLLYSFICAIPPDVRKATATGEFVDLEKIHGFVPGTVSVMPFSDAFTSLDMVMEKPSVGKKIPDALHWGYAYSLWSGLREKLFPFEKEILKDHGTYMETNFRIAPHLAPLYITAEAVCRKTIGTPGCPDSLASLPAAIATWILHNSIVTPRGNSGSGGSGTPNPTPTTAAASATFAPAALATSMVGTIVLTTEDKASTKRSRTEMEGESLEETTRDPRKQPKLSEDQVPESYRLSGTTTIPKLRRNLHFPVSSFPSTPSVDSLLVAAPFPTVPSSVTSDAVINYTLALRPDLFKVTTPLKVDRLERLLQNHPNRPLVDSAMLGLREGFWPGHDGDFTEADKLSGPAENLDDKALDFLTDYAAEDHKKGYLSDSFKTLYPGMHISKTHVTVPANGIGRMRGVVDLTGSGLNGGVSKEISKVTYDAQQVLGTLARHRHRRGELNRPGIVSYWWKSDLSGGFRNIPVSKYWQIKQVHRIRQPPTRKSHGRHYWVYFVDQRLLLGGRMSPRIFCTIMSLVLWATKVELFLEYPMAFVDDAFGIDVSGVKILITHPHTNESRLVPADQGRLLLMWNFVNFPWDWKKQPSSADSLLIIGNIFRKTATELTVSLAPEAVAAFALQVEEFLSSKDGKAKLVDWQKITGYANWAVGVLPFARFALQELYDKIAGKSNRNALVAINTTVRKNLAWFVNELQTAPPLDLLDPALDHWQKGDADMIIWTDACLTSDDGSSGLGYWARMGDYTWHCYHRCPEKMTDIVLAEALAIFSAIMWAASIPGVRRLLLYTDSSGSVYAYDSGKAHGMLHDLVWTAYLELQKFKVDLRIRHIPGVPSKPIPFQSPDPLVPGIHAVSGAKRKTLSKFPPADSHAPTVVSSFPASYNKHARFAEHPPLDFPTERSAPPISLADLTKFRDSLVYNALAPGTKRGYDVAMKHWRLFCATYKIPRVPSTDTLSLFVAYLSSKHIKDPTKVLSGLADHFKTEMADWETQRFHPLIARSLKGARRLPHALIIRAAPVLPSHLNDLAENAIRPGASYDDVLGAAIAIWAFGGVMRLGDCLLLPDKAEDRDARKVILRNKTTLVPGESFSFFLPYTKTDPTYIGADVRIDKEFSPGAFNYVHILEMYLRRRDERFGPDGPLILRENGTAPMRSWFIPLLKRFAPGVTGHGLRAGGATFLAELGIPDSIIRRMGRWSSDAFEIYIRTHPALMAIIAIHARRAAARLRKHRA
ncbi:hypothetical protein P7C70_g8184, partial [Phenoliferia sp. Uapishka_3]